MAQLNQVRDLTGEFLGWWWRELTGLVPARLRQLLPERDDDATIAEVIDGGIAWRGSPAGRPAPR